MEPILEGGFTGGIGGIAGMESDEDEDEARDLTSEGGEFDGVGSFSWSSVGSSTGESTAMTSGEPEGDADSSSGRGRCSARNVSLPTLDIPRCRHRRMRTSLGSVRGRSSTTLRLRFRGVRPVGMSSLVASSTRYWVAWRIAPRELLAAAFRLSTAADMPDVSVRIRLVMDSTERDVDAMLRCM